MESLAASALGVTSGFLSAKAPLGLGLIQTIKSHSEGKRNTRFTSATFFAMPILTSVSGCGLSTLPPASANFLALSCAVGLLTVRPVENVVKVLAERYPAAVVDAPDRRRLRRAALEHRKIGAQQVSVNVVPELAGMLRIAALPLEVSVADRAVFVLVAETEVSRLFGVGRRREPRGQIFLNALDEGDLSALRLRRERRFGRRSGCDCSAA